MSPLRNPPPDLAGFPRYLLLPRHALHRIHPLGRAPWWFSSEGSGRFDLQFPLGTRHLAEQPLGAFIETFRGIALVAEADVASRRLSTLHVPVPLRLADCTSRRAAAYGVTAAIHATEDYERTQAWAAAFTWAGFDGVRYLLSHDPAQRLRGVALFGPAGQRDWPVERTERLGRDLVEEARQHFGVLVLPTP